MFMYNHHTTCINISQCSCINTIHPSLEPCRNPRFKTRKHCDEPQIEHLHFAATMSSDSLAGDATPIDIGSSFTIVEADL